MPPAFDPEVLHAIARKAVGLPHDRMFETVEGALDEAYPGLINRDTEWLFYNAGGVTGTMKLLYCSFDEYVMFFGTAIGTEGHSGRLPVEIHEFILEGELRSYTEGQHVADVYGPGDEAVQERGRARGYRIPERAWMLEYGRGPLFRMASFALVSTLLITQDMRTLRRNFVVMGRLMWRALRARRRRRRPAITDRSR